MKFIQFPSDIKNPGEWSFLESGLGHRTLSIGTMEGIVNHHLSPFEYFMLNMLLELNPKLITKDSNIVSTKSKEE